MKYIHQYKHRNNIDSTLITIIIIIIYVRRVAASVSPKLTENKTATKFISLSFIMLLLIFVKFSMHLLHCIIYLFRNKILKT